MNIELFLTKLAGIRCEELCNNKKDLKLLTSYKNSLVRFHEMIVKKCTYNGSNKMGYITYHKNLKL